MLKAEDTIEDLTNKLIEFVNLEPNDIDSTIFKIESIQTIFQSLHGDKGCKPFLKDYLEAAKKLKRKSDMVEEDIKKD